MSSYAGAGPSNAGLVFEFDTANIKKSWKGAPTANLLSGSGISIYNNVPGDVNATLVQTTETYNGVPIWKLTLVPLTSTGVSQLTNGANPGIGVNYSGGGGLASRYTGHSIFFKPTGPMYGAPIFTQYSNIGGWQSSTNYDDMGEGWFRANVIWYDTVARSDTKFWAINPAGATLNVPIVIYWAGPFKEDRNDSVCVSTFTANDRSASQAILDMTGNFTIPITSLTYSSNNNFSFNGSSDKITGVQSAYTDSANTVSRSWEVVVKPSVLQNISGIFGHALSGGCTYYCNGGIGVWSGRYAFIWYDNSAYQFLDSGIPATGNQSVHITCTYSGADNKARIYINGVLRATSGVTSLNYGSAVNEFQIGYLSASGNYFNGTLNIAKYYHGKLLSDSEAAQNFYAVRSRFGI